MPGRLIGLPTETQASQSAKVTSNLDTAKGVAACEPSARRTCGESPASAFIGHISGVELLATSVAHVRDTHAWDRRMWHFGHAPEMNPDKSDFSVVFVCALER